MIINKALTEHFSDRHIGPNENENNEILGYLKIDSVETLISQTVPANIKHPHPLKISESVTEHELLTALREKAAKNKVYDTYIGCGYHDCITPGVIQRNILENPGWYTQYTPYQAEISQGRLEALLNFQTLVADLTGLPIANASLLDEGTAAAEAISMLYAVRDKEVAARGAKTVFVSQHCLPQTIDVLKGKAKALGLNLVIGDEDTYTPDENVFAALIQYPRCNGEVVDYKAFCDKLNQTGAKCAVAADLMSLVLLTPPSEFGAQVVVGSSQRFGVPLGFGGPHAAFFATTDEYKRKIPGRIIGVSVDRLGNRALRMALQTREQHIRREKATSNICTAQALLAIMASMYAVYHGPKGLKAIATRINALTAACEALAQELGYTSSHSNYFDTIQLKVPTPDTIKTLKTLADTHHINLRYIDNDTVGISLNETVTAASFKRLIAYLAEAVGKPVPSSLETLEIAQDNIQDSFKRTSSILDLDVFKTHHSETQMLRYIKQLENKDLSLNTAMIPLGSCTMKLNATTEMVPLSFPEFSKLHPFAPKDQTLGYRAIIKELEEDLATITGFSAVSLQPNSGAQGEYTGLLTIKAYHEDRGESNRTIVLIPSSAHGTNPASAVVAGLDVAIVKCAENGDIDMDDLKAKIEQHKDNLCGLMITYPSTHGVFETTIMEICELIHNAGGLVYMDGANMNAQVGITSPGFIGADVCHLNLHKTFAIPHGGGGPGMGPICVNDKLKPYLPNHPLVELDNEKGIPAVAAAPWGSASILLISYIYIKLLGVTGLLASTEQAILSANYIKERLKDHYDILFTGENGNVAHELIIDCRAFKKEAKIEVEDIAKRLIDYGFHAPTMSWPVPGTLMIEPTESEDKAEMDRFCEAMITIKAEIQAIIDGKADPVDNVLKNAPHTAEEVIEEWTHPYTRNEAIYPAGKDFQKFWPSVSRVDNAHGDRNLICTCAPIEAYA